MVLLKNLVENLYLNIFKENSELTIEFKNQILYENDLDEDEEVEKNKKKLEKTLHNLGMH